MTTENMTKSFTAGVITGIGLSICYEQLYNAEWLKNLKNKLFASNVKLNSQPSVEPVALNESAPCASEKKETVIVHQPDDTTIIENNTDVVEDHTEDPITNDPITNGPVDNHTVMLIANAK